MIKALTASLLALTCGIAHADSTVRTLPPPAVGRGPGHGAADRGLRRWLLLGACRASSST